MRYNECTKCRRINSNLCTNCKNASLFLTNDSRMFYYINCEREKRRGPVEAFLLPYKDVWPDSYVWTKGMENWDFAGKVLDRLTLIANFNYCPICNGTFDRQIIYPDDRETMYRCRQCGFRFTYGATRMVSAKQREYTEQYNTNGKVPVLPKGHKIRYNVRDISITITIEGVKSIESAYIVYNCTRMYDNKSNSPERIELVELFLCCMDDSRDKDGRRIVTRPQCNYGQMEKPFYDYISESCHYPERQVSEYYGEEYGLSQYFINANNTRYFIKHDAAKQILVNKHKAKPSFLDRIIVGACAASSGYCMSIWAMHDLNASHAEYAFGGFVFAVVGFMYYKFKHKA